MNNEIYFSRVEFFDGRDFTDIWTTKEDMLSYVENISKDEIKRVEAFILTPKDEYSVRYDNQTCIYEYDVNGIYFYNVA